ncbi:MAG: hypothetical protein JXQ83_04755, partial [Candidatus Glassbacteria bacterium]|nr:hypothetical protein [Candidatus Glassbacteria bacterium]
MRRKIILIALLLYPAAAYAQLGGSAPLFAVGIERASLQDSTDPRAALRVWLESSKEIPAAEFTISYDPGKLKALEVSPGGPLEPFSIFEKDLETPGRVEILAADFSGETIPAGKTENLFTVSFAVLP